MNAGEMKVALRNRFEPPAWALFFEVANGTGANASRRADAIAMSVWPSRGLELHGLEVKVSRSDWLREKDNPEKAEPIFKFMDRFWLAVSEADIIKPGELPPTWGLLVPKGKALIAKVEAPKLEAKPISRGFLAALLRRAHESAHKLSQDEIRAVKDAAWKEANEVLAAQKKHQDEYGEYGELKRSVAAFEAASGIKLSDRWRAGRIGRAVQKVLSQENQGPPEERLRQLRSIAQAIVCDLDAAIAPAVEDAPSDPVVLPT